MMKFDVRVKLGRVTSGDKIAVSAFKGQTRNTHVNAMLKYKPSQYIPSIVT